MNTFLPCRWCSSCAFGFPFKIASCCLWIAAGEASIPDMIYAVGKELTSCVCILSISSCEAEDPGAAWPVKQKPLLLSVWRLALAGGRVAVSDSISVGVLAVSKSGSEAEVSEAEVSLTMKWKLYFQKYLLYKSLIFFASWEKNKKLNKLFYCL